MVMATTAWHTTVVGSDGEVNVRFAPVSGPTQQLRLFRVVLRGNITQERVGVLSPMEGLGVCSPETEWKWGKGAEPAKLAPCVLMAICKCELEVGDGFLMV
jgi:hypothetical protein